MPHNRSQYAYLQHALHDLPCGDTSKLAAITTRVALGLGLEAVKDPTQSLQRERKPCRRPHNQMETIPDRKKTRSLISRVVAANIHVSFVQGGSIRSEYKGPRRLISPGDLDRGVTIHVTSRNTAIEIRGFIIQNSGWAFL